MRPERATGRASGPSSRSPCATGRTRRSTSSSRAVDPDNEMRFSFQKPRFTVEPGRRNGSAIMVTPPKPAWVGRPVQRRFEITSTVIGSETGALPKAAFLTQKPWIPAWALLLLPAAADRRDRGLPALAAHRDRAGARGMEMIAAEQALADAGLTLGNQTQKATDAAKPGTILAQSPVAGRGGRRRLGGLDRASRSRPAGARCRT